MKFLCSFLILVGVLALSDASLSYEDQMLIANDELMLEELRRIADDRAMSSADCSKIYLEDLSKALDNYNSDLKLCEEAQENLVKSLKKAASKVVGSLTKQLQNSCDKVSNCAELEDPIDILACYGEKSSEAADSITVTGNDAATAKTELEKDIANAVNTGDVCNSQAYALYSSQSTTLNKNFNDCVNGKTSETKPPVSTEGPEVPPQEETSQKPPEEEKEQDEEEEKPKQRSWANKYQRF